MNVAVAFLKLINQHFNMSLFKIHLNSGYSISYEMHGDRFCFHYTGGTIGGAGDAPDLYEFSVRMSDPNAVKYVVDCCKIIERRVQSD